MFTGRVVLITGATGGIGKETVKAFAGRGATVALVDLHRDVLETTARELDLQEGKYLLLPADVSKEEQVEGYVRKTKDTFGKIDVFFNNAGVPGGVAPITEYPSDLLDAVINVNIKGVFYGLKHVLRVMKEQKAGCVINTSSIAGLKGLPLTSGYNAAKFAVVGLTKTAAVEMAPDGVRVNAVCPAPVDTYLMRSLEAGMAPGNPAAAREHLKTIIPLGRYGTAREVAETVVFLASDAAGYITGAVLPVDGGVTV